MIIRKEIRPIKSSLLKESPLEVINGGNPRDRIDSSTSFGQFPPSKHTTQPLNRLEANLAKNPNILVQTNTILTSELANQPEKKYSDASINVPPNSPYMERITFNDSSLQATIYQPLIPNNLDFGVIVLNQRQVNRYYEWRRENPGENFDQFMERLRRSSQNGENLRTPRLSHMLTQATGAAPVYLSSLSSKRDTAPLALSQSVLNEPNILQNYQNSVQRQTADARMQTGSTIGLAQTSIHTSSYPALQRHTSDAVLPAGNRPVLQIGVPLTNTNQTLYRPPGLSAEPIHSNQSFIPQFSNNLRGERPIHTTRQPTTIGEAYPSTTVRQESSLISSQKFSSSSPNLHRPVVIQSSTNYSPTQQYLGQPGPAAYTPSITGTTKLPLRPAPICGLSTGLQPSVSFGQPPPVSIAQSPAPASPQPLTFGALKPLAGPGFTVPASANLIGQPGSQGYQAGYQPLGTQTAVGRERRTSGDERRTSQKAFDANILVVDDYETIPAHLQRRIEDIAERCGAKPRIVVVDDVTPEDREMDELMKQVYERVNSSHPDRASQAGINKLNKLRI
jgi:hypothetical protein